PSCSPGGSRKNIVETYGKQMAGVVITVPIIEFGIKRVISYYRSIFADLIQGMSPNVGKLRAQTMPCPHPEGTLHGIVIGSTDAVELQDGAEVGKGII